MLSFRRQSNDIWRRIEQYKPVSIEPKGKEAFLAAMNHYYETVNDVKTNGAVFAAVCRGKVNGLLTRLAV